MVHQQQVEKLPGADPAGWETGQSLRTMRADAGILIVFSRRRLSAHCPALLVLFSEPHASCRMAIALKHNVSSDD